MGTKEAPPANKKKREKDYGASNVRVKRAYLTILKISIQNPDRYLGLNAGKLIMSTKQYKYLLS